MGFFITMNTGIDFALIKKSFEKVLSISKSPLKKCIFVKKAIDEKVKIF